MPISMHADFRPDFRMVFRPTCLLLHTPFVTPSSIMLPTGFHFFERGWLSSNNLLILSADVSLLLDSAYVTHAPQTLDLVQATLGQRPLDRLVNTHLHSDHCGGNALMQAQFPQLETWIPPGLSSAVTAWDTDALSYGPTGQDCPAFKWTHLLRPGTLLDAGNCQWEIHAAPGHDPHAVILFEPVARILMSADALWKQGFGVVFPELDGVDAFADVASTLDLIERLAPRFVLPGHGPMFSTLAPALAAARRRLDGFVREPERHRRHALKVLIKFKLLACGEIARSSLLAWTQGTPYFASILKHCCREADTKAYLDEVLLELESQGALRQANGRVCNC
jgi:glyoxylase-like metal-dependent hydrolase (beta-lactamase superfamily II)